MPATEGFGTILVNAFDLLKVTWATGIAKIIEYGSVALFYNLFLWWMLFMTVCWDIRQHSIVAIWKKKPQPSFERISFVDTRADIQHDPHTCVYPGESADTASNDYPP